jgi:putative intracellular protease/amidase
MQNINVILFDDFTALDVFGPTEVLGRLKEHFRINYISMNGGTINGSTGAKIDTVASKEVKEFDILLLPGGFGTRKLVEDPIFLNLIRTFAEKSKTVLSVCTGSALLAKAGVLKKRNATSNKISWEWVIQQDPEVHWIRKAHWVVDGKFYTSSGVTAGIDMALGFVADIFGTETARKISRSIEHIWNEDNIIDPFSE